MAEVILAEHYGMCAGAYDCISSARRIAAQSPNRNVYTFGHILNNSEVVRSLQESGVGCLYVPGSRNFDYSRLLAAAEQVQSGDVVIITAHGIEKEIEEMLSKRAEVHDLTCRFGVKSAQKLMEKAKNGTGGILYAREKSACHPEVRGIMSRGSSYLLHGRSQLYQQDFENFVRMQETAVFMLAKTTEDKSRFEDLANEAERRVSYLRPQIGFQKYDTVCLATQKRQQALKELLPRAGSVVVVGDEKSANTMELARIAQERVPAKIVLGPRSLDGFRPAEPVVVTGGASAFRETVEAVADRIRQARA